MLCGILEAGLVSDCLLKDLSFPVAAVIMSIVWNVTRQLVGVGLCGISIVE